MIEFLIATAAFIVAIALLIAIHEFGHFIVARKLGVRVEKFSVGFGPSLFSWYSRDGEVEYIIAAIPLGGYVKMLGESPSKQSDNPDQQKDSNADELTPEDLKRAFHTQAVWKRAAIAVAGPAFNFIFAIIAYMIVGWAGQQVIPPMVGHITPDSIAEQAGILPADVIKKVNGHSVYAWQHVEEALKKTVGQPLTLTIDRTGMVMDVHMDVPMPEKDALLSNIGGSLLGFAAGQRVFAQQITPHSAAAQAGLKDGDEIIRMDQQTVDDVRSLIQYIQSHAGMAITLGVMRGDLKMNLKITPQADAKTQRGRIGILLNARSIQAPVVYRMGRFEGAAYGFTRTWDMTTLTFEVLGKMMVNAISPSNLGGPIAIAQMAGKTAEYGVIPYLLFLALFSVNLGVLNLLPVPILDGGHLTYLSIEALRGRPLSPETIEKTQLVGVLMIAALMIFAFYNDIARFLQG
ncbi:MAG: RIP metalloprotease RseP [Mariprofundaceae bacterium]|nr:RIP metalloprotease RseP [Mariprofundaceae bacterium]